MISRRTVLSGTTVGGVLASLEPHAEAAPEAAALQVDQSVAALAAVARAVSAMNADVTQAINSLKNEFRQQNVFADIEVVRTPIRMYLRNTAKFPEYIEVGTDIWQTIYDWHIRSLQPLVIARTAEGRYTIQLMSTICIMRVELPPNYIGVPYDNR
jgi:hypothetical protein